ncbi:hypothetical protein DFH29DRAFT_877277 [Suillus ampliporus]|nr:hypothetical protein DFH29DRAFT_877277 [Suillus ampliporus]
MSCYAPYATTQPSWIKDMMTHVQADRVSEFSTSGSSDNTILPPPSSLKNLPTLPSLPTDSPSAQPLMRLGDTEASHEFKSSVSTTIPTNKEKRSHTSHTRHRGAPLEQLQTLKQLSNDNIVGVRIRQAEEGNKSMVSKLKPGRVDGGVTRARACRTTSAGQTCKRKVEDVDAKHNINQENIDKPALVETRKRIFWEKTGGDGKGVEDAKAGGNKHNSSGQDSGYRDRCNGEVDMPAKSTSVVMAREQQDIEKRILLAAASERFKPRTGDVEWRNGTHLPLAIDSMPWLDMGTGSVKDHWRGALGWSVKYWYFWTIILYPSPTRPLNQIM